MEGFLFLTHLAIYLTQRVHALARCSLLSMFSYPKHENTRRPDGFRHPSAAVAAKLHS